MWPSSAQVDEAKTFLNRKFVEEGQHEDLNFEWAVQLLMSAFGYDEQFADMIVQTIGWH